MKYWQQIKVFAIYLAHIDLGQQNHKCSSTTLLRTLPKKTHIMISQHELESQKFKFTTSFIPTFTHFETQSSKYKSTIS
jgi:hypothetical protein